MRLAELLMELDQGREDGRKDFGVTGRDEKGWDEVFIKEDICLCSPEEVLNLYKNARKRRWEMMGRQRAFDELVREHIAKERALWGWYLYHRKRWDDAEPDAE